VGFFDAQEFSTFDCYSVGFTQTTDFTLCRFFFALQGKKEPTKEEKYHCCSFGGRYNWLKELA
jgi:hypothetical protein